MTHHDDCTKNILTSMSILISISIALSTTSTPLSLCPHRHVIICYHAFTTCPGLCRHAS